MALLLPHSTVNYTGTFWQPVLVAFSCADGVALESGEPLDIPAGRTLVEGLRAFHIFCRNFKMNYRSMEQTSRTPIEMAGRKG